jgi:hypothetical protein
MVENSLLGAHVFIYSLDLLCPIFSKMMFIFLMGALGIVNTKIIKGKQSIRKPLFFWGENIPQYNGSYQPRVQMLKFLTRPNLHGVNRFDFKIFYTNDKKAYHICHLK